VKSENRLAEDLSKKNTKEQTYNSIYIGGKVFERKVVNQIVKGCGLWW